MTSPSVMSRLGAFIKKYPIVKGMITYSVLWPTSNLCQQAIRGRRPEQLDFAEAGRFCIFGTFVVSPTLYTWVKIIGRLIPGNTFKVAVQKALVEQVLYSPFAISLFYGGLTLLENKSLDEAKAEIRAKFWPTYRTGICIWPLVQTVNFALVKERNRVMVVGICSFFWTVFLSYMKQLDKEKAAFKKLRSKPKPICIN